MKPMPPLLLPSISNATHTNETYATTASSFHPTPVIHPTQLLTVINYHHKPLT
jgi:hypothetical protein